MALSYSLVQLWGFVYVCVLEQDLNFASVAKETFHALVCLKIYCYLHQLQTKLILTWKKGINCI